MIYPQRTKKHVYSILANKRKKGSKTNHRNPYLTCEKTNMHALDGNSSHFVCLSVTSHLWSLCPEIALTDSVSNVGRTICGCFSETALFQSYGTFCIVRLLWSRPFHLCKMCVSLPSYERYQQLQQLKHTNICSVFAKMTAFQLYRETATAADPSVV